MKAPKRIFCPSIDRRPLVRGGWFQHSRARRRAARGPPRKLAMKYCMCEHHCCDMLHRNIIQSNGLRGEALVQGATSMTWLTDEQTVSAARERAEKALRIPLGMASPLWLAFGAATSVGAAWWLMTRWTRAVNLEAMTPFTLTSP